jgi:histidinol-phosphate aminotransferase
MRDYTFDLEAILAAITPETRLVCVANPNNPTGTMFFAGALDRVIERVPQHVMIALDEAYSDYAEFHAGKKGEIYSRSIEYVRQGRQNVVVLRTFSKAHGLAGLRVGLRNRRSTDVALLRSGKDRVFRFGNRRSGGARCAPG